MDLEAAAARQAAMDTPRIALAPSLDLFGVPSNSIILASKARISTTSIPVRAGAMISLTFLTA
eukprot:Pgem_evm2s10880